MRVFLGGLFMHWTSLEKKKHPHLGHIWQRSSPWIPPPKSAIAPIFLFGWAWIWTGWRGDFFPFIYFWNRSPPSPPLLFGFYDFARWRRNCGATVHWGINIEQSSFCVFFVSMGPTIRIWTDNSVKKVQNGQLTKFQALIHLRSWDICKNVQTVRYKNLRFCWAKTMMETRSFFSIFWFLWAPRSWFEPIVISRWSNMASWPNFNRWSLPYLEIFAKTSKY